MIELLGIFIIIKAIRAKQYRALPATIGVMLYSAWHSLMSLPILSASIINHSGLFSWIDKGLLLVLAVCLMQEGGRHGKL